MADENGFRLTHLARPPTVRREGKSPGILLLHGVGANEEDLMGLAPYLDPRFHILSARAPIALGPNSYGWYRIEILPDGSFHFSEEEARWSLSLLDTFVDEVVEEYELDRERFYLVGFSQGAIQSCALLLTAPEKIAGIVMMSGRWPTPVERERVADERLEGKPVLVVHGQYDPVISIAYGREVREKFSDLPVRLSYQEYPMGHHVSDESLRFVDGWLRERLAEASHENA